MSTQRRMAVPLRSAGRFATLRHLLAGGVVPWRTLGAMLCGAFCTALLLACLPLASAPAAPATPAAAGSAAALTTLPKPERWRTLADPGFEHIGTEQGLPHPVATALAEDGDGFLWVGTRRGLARWDGYRFKVWLANANDPHALPDNFIQTLYRDRHGQLWIGCGNGALVRYDRGSDRFETLNNSAIGGAGAIWAIAEDGGDGIWFGRDNGLHHVDAKGGKLSHWRQQAGALRGLPDNRVRALLRSKDGTLWLGTGAGLVRRAASDTRPGDGGFLPVVLGTTPLASSIASVKAPEVRSLLQARDGRIWVSVQQQGVYLLDPHNGHSAMLRRDQGSGVLAESQFVLAMAQTAQGEIWLAAHGQGLLLADQDGRLGRRMQHQHALPGSLLDDMVSAILPDRSGLLWVATQRGLSRIDPGQNAVLTLYGRANREDGLADADIESVLAAADGRIWLGLANHGVDIIDPGAQSLHGLRPQVGQASQFETALPAVKISALAQEGAGAILLGSARGVYRADAAGSGVRRLDLTPRNPTSVVFAMQVTGKQIWLGGLDGLWQGNPAANSASRLPDGLQLSDQRVAVIETAADGAIWIGTGHGLNRWQPSTRTLESILPNLADAGALASGDITTLLFDRQGHLWVGSIGGGIQILTGRNAAGQPRFLRLGLEQGLPSLNIHKLLLDDAGQVWASSDAGIVQIDAVKLRGKVLQRADGLLIDSYISGSGARTAHGELLFGGHGGLTVVRPALLPRASHAPPVVVSEIRIGGKTVAAAAFNQPNQGAPAATLLIPAHNNHFSVQFAALDYSSPANNRHAWRLEGYDDNWIETDASQRLAAYTNLAPGAYHLHLRGSNRHGEWSPHEINIPLRVLPAWYQTWWCHSLEALLALLALIALVQGRTGYLRRAKNALEGEVARRTGELVAANQNLRQANHDLAVSAETLRELEHIGREITRTLELEAVFEALYSHVVGLTRASSLLIFRMNNEQNTLERCFGREDGLSLPHVVIPIDSPISNAAQAARERREVLGELRADEDNPSHIPGTRRMLTAVFEPLIVDSRLVGVMSIQSDRPQAFGERERQIFHTLCSYGAIAFDNANAYAKLKQAQAQLVAQEKLAALGALVAGVAHELNTPLGNSVMMTSLLQENIKALSTRLEQKSLQKDDLASHLLDAQEALDCVMRGLNSATRLVTSFKQVAVDRTTAQRRVFDLLETSTEVIDTLMSQIHADDHRIRIEIAPGIALDSYPGAYGQVLISLVQNALVHGLAGRRQGQIVLAAQMQAGGGRVLVSVRDNGTGIAPQHLNHVFDPFFTTTMGRGSNGLGLSISYNIVTSLLCGQISVVSALGGGTTLTLDLPLAAG
jgi:ligand-binding sensor domain-containing protein/signal transduction histidine kinase